MIYRGLVVTGTDTGVGKTVIAEALLRLFRESGMRVGVLKPVETGCEGEKRRPEDAMKLAAAAGLDPGPLDGSAPKGFPAWEDIVPWRFRAPLAPAAAASLENITISVDRIFTALDRWTAYADLILVETAGGILVPLNPGFTFADLLQGFELPVVVVAVNRLGAINHTLLTLEALRARKITPVAVVLNQVSSSADLSAGENAALIAEYGKVQVAVTPYAAEPVAAAVAALRPALAEIRRAMEEDWKRTALRYLGREE